jgi:flagellar biogenesis protein FliO
MEILRQLLAVALVLALAAGASWWLRRGGPLRPAKGTLRGRLRRLELLERLPLGPQQALCLVRSGDRALTLLVHPGGGLLLENRPVGEFEIVAEADVPLRRPAAE